MEMAIKVAKEQNAHVQGTISYTISPFHTIEKYVEFAKELENLECDSLTIKDMAGLLSPHDTYELITTLKEETESYDKSALSLYKRYESYKLLCSL